MELHVEKPILQCLHNFGEYTVDFNGKGWTEFNSSTAYRTILTM